MTPAEWTALAELEKAGPITPNALRQRTIFAPIYFFNIVLASIIRDGFILTNGAGEIVLSDKGKKELLIGPIFEHYNPPFPDWPGGS